MAITSRISHKDAWLRLETYVSKDILNARLSTIESSSDKTNQKPQPVHKNDHYEMILGPKGTMTTKWK